MHVYVVKIQTHSFTRILTHKMYKSCMLWALINPRRLTNWLQYKSEATSRGVTLDDSINRKSENPPVHSIYVGFNELFTEIGSDNLENQIVTQ